MCRSACEQGCGRIKMPPENLISVIMGVRYLRPELNTLRRSVDSILAQTYSDFELVICERGSTEQAKALLAEYAMRDSRIRLISGEETGSFSEQLNVCLKESYGAWIARMDDDDFSFPERFEKQIEYLRSHDAAFVGCNVRLVQDGADAGVQCFPETPQARDFLFSMPFIHPALMFRRDVLENVGGYSALPRCERCEDYDLLMRLYEKGYYGANLQEFLFAYSLPHNGISTRNFRDRTNEVRTRWTRFAALGLFPLALPYAIKPWIIWLLPQKMLKRLKEKRAAKSSGKYMR